MKKKRILECLEFKLDKSGFDLSLYQYNGINKKPAAMSRIVYRRIVHAETRRGSFGVWTVVQTIYNKW